MSWFRIAAVMLLGAVLCPLPAQDAVVLKNGARLEGEILAETAESITLQFRGGSVTLPIKQVASVERAARPEEAGEAEAAPPEKVHSLDRFAERETWYFLYREGKRVGYRVLSMRVRRDAETPGYVLTDWLVFLDRPGGTVRAELLSEEEVDPELEPLRAFCRVSDARSVSEVRAERDGDALRLSRMADGNTTAQGSLRAEGLELPGIWLQRSGREAGRRGRTEPSRILDLRSLRVHEVGLRGRREEVLLWGEQKDVDVVSVGADPRHGLGAWLDRDGTPLRQEIQSRQLVALQAPQALVMAYVRGEGAEGARDLGLEFISARSGVRLLRPDLAWELLPGEGAVPRIVSLVRTSLQASVDLVLIPGSQEEELESSALRLVNQMRRGAKSIDARPPRPHVLGGRSALLFEVRAERDGTEVRTKVALTRCKGGVLAFLCAAPLLRFPEVEADFERVLRSVRFYRPDEERRPDDPPEGGDDT